MKEKWLQRIPKVREADWGKRWNLSPLIVRLLVNRNIATEEEAYNYLFGSYNELHDPYLMKGMKEGVKLLLKAISSHEKIAIATDFDCDGIFAGQILYETIRNVGGNVILYAPDRHGEGYGLNKRIVDEAWGQGCRLLITSDNGISAYSEIKYAKEIGFTVIVTDHHDVPFSEENGKKEFLFPPADVIIDPKQEGCKYPFKELCGAGICFRLAEMLYKEARIPSEKYHELAEYAGIATVCDVVPVRDENRIIVREGLKAWNETDKVPLQALLNVAGLSDKSLNAYHMGFRLGPSFNAIGRLSNVRLAFRFLKEESEVKATEVATEILALNEERKKQTEEGYNKALEFLAKDPHKEDSVLLLPLPGVDPSVSGIIAGRLKERFYHPVFVFTEEGDSYRGSARSIEGYPLSDVLNRHRDLLIHYGGHAMAAGVTIRKDKFEEFREALNLESHLTEEDFIPKIYFDCVADPKIFTVALAESLRVIEPTGTDNPSPLFAGHFYLKKVRLFGNERKVLRLTVSYRDLKTEQVSSDIEMTSFRDSDELITFLRDTYGEEETAKVCNKEAMLPIALLYSVGINEFRGEKKTEYIVQYYDKSKERKEEEK